MIKLKKNWVVSFEETLAAYEDLETLFEFYEAGDVEEDELLEEGKKATDSIENLEFKNIGNTKDSKDYKTVLKETMNKVMKDMKNKVLSGNVGNALNKVKNIDQDKIKEKIKKELFQNKDKVKDKLKKLLNKN